MITFGLTGGIACGKSTATKTIKSLGIPMVDADLVARDVVAPGSTGLRMIAETFGDGHLLSDGTLNRTTFAKLVFSDSVAMSKLNQIMSPLINEESVIQIKRWHSKGNPMVGYDAALIVEMGNADKYRPLIVMTCPQEMQIERMMRRNGMTRDDALARIKNQIPIEEKVKLADYVIDTSGSVEDSRLQTKKIIHAMRKSIGRFCFECGRHYGEGDKAVMCEGCGFDNPFEN